jgi:hypothetical protein
MPIRGMTGGLDASTVGVGLGCLCSAPPQDLQKADEKWIGRNLDSASMSARRPSLLIDLLADYGDSALIDAGSIPS